MKCYLNIKINDDRAKISLKTLLLVFTFSVMHLALSGQIIMLDEEVSEEVYSRKIGPNGTHYFSGIFAITSRFSMADELDVKPFRSMGVDVGVRYKLRFCNFYSNVFDLKLSSLRYGLKSVGDIEPYSLATWNREYLKGGSMMGSWYQRFNFGKRGNHLGKFIDVGVYGQYNYMIKHRFLGEDGSVKVEAERKAFSYINRTEWGLSAGLGWNKIRFVGRYRMSDLVKPGAATLDLPRFLVGIEFSS